MKVRQLIEQLKEMDGNQDIEFYVWDFEYSDTIEDAYEIGSGNFINIEDGYINLRVK